MKATIDLPLLPPTLNEILKAAKKHWSEYSKLKSAYTRDCALWALGTPQFTGKVWLHFYWRVKTQRRDPADNTPAAAKFVLDGLVQAGILKDDSGYVIQPPVIHEWEIAKEEGLRLTISDQPIYRLEKI